MEENKDCTGQSAGKNIKNGAREFFFDILRGFPIGVAFIIPGFSGGSVAAIMGIYEKMIGAIVAIFRNMRKSIVTLLPIGLGLVLGAIALLFPIDAALDAFPLPTVSLFIGLTIGGMPSVLDKISGKPTVNNIIAFSIPMMVALVLSFVPLGNDVDLFNLTPGGYVLLFMVGMLGATALVIPGISGSMMLLIFGYYNPIVKMIIMYFLAGKDFWICVFVLGTCAAGIGVGFLLISFVMKTLLEKYQRGTYFAIVGFIVGSLPTVYISTMKSAGMLSASLEVLWMPKSPLYWIFSVVMIAVGIFATYSFMKYSRKIMKK